LSEEAQEHDINAAKELNIISLPPIIFFVFDLKYLFTPNEIDIPAAHAEK
jgi:hypothetical protein